MHKKKWVHYNQKVFLYSQFFKIRNFHALKLGNQFNLLLTIQQDNGGVLFVDMAFWMIVAIADNNFYIAAFVGTAC